MIAILALLAEHAFFAAQVEAARRNMEIPERVQVAAFYGVLRTPYGGRGIAAGLPMPDGSWLVIYNQGWLRRAKADLCVGVGCAAWVAYHEACHIAVDAAAMSRPARDRREFDAVELRADDCANAWVAELKRRAKEKRRRP